MALYEYKTTERGSRVQNVEEAFSKGMYWTDMPLTEGYVKTLVNFDIKDNGSSITPRAGYQMYDHYGDPIENFIQYALKYMANPDTISDAMRDVLEHTFELCSARYRADRGYSEFVLTYSNKKNLVYAPNAPSSGYKANNPHAYYGRCIIAAGSRRYDEAGNPTEGYLFPGAWGPCLKDT